jgi:uncharacterized protein
LDKAERKAAFILLAIAVPEGAWVALNLVGRPMRFWRYTGFVYPGRAGILAWLLALICAALFTWRAAQLPSVRANLIRPSRLKILALVLAIAAAFCEEAVFRKLLMDTLQHYGSPVGVQILVSGLAFGVAHGIWGFFRGSIRAASGAVMATGILGVALAAIYIVGRRVLSPCVVAHFLINLFIEPGLVLAAVRGEMGQTLGATDPV